jgi:ABC-type multidrug transport system fused ATPase/permease subunit
MINSERMLELFKERPTVVDEPTAEELPSCEGEIRFDDVKFSSTPGSQPSRSSFAARLVPLPRSLVSPVVASPPSFDFCSVSTIPSWKHSSRRSRCQRRDY